MKARYGPCLECGKHRELADDDVCKWCRGVAARTPQQARKRSDEHARTDKPYEEAAAGREALQALDALRPTLRQIYENSRRRKGRRK